jgi:hypothetical protein
MLIPVMADKNCFSLGGGIKLGKNVFLVLRLAGF